MIASLLLGIFFIVFGITHRARKKLHIISIVVGIVLVLLAVYLALPK